MNNMELETDIEALDMEMGDVTIHYCPVIPNPEGEPTAELKTADIEGTIYEIVDEEARTELENKVDKVEGKDLSTNDYTDEDKAIVDGVTEALNGKVDKDGDKVLSDNNYSDEDKAIVDGVTSALNGKADKSNTYTKSEVDSALDNKVDKVEGKGLSENDFTDALKDKLDGIEAEANKTIVDSTISSTSENPLQNKAIYNFLNDLLPEATETGNPISITNASGLNAKSLKVELEPIQDLNGYDSPWVGGGGKNLLKITSSSTTINGITYTVNSDGTVLVNGTATANSAFSLIDNEGEQKLVNMDSAFILSGCPIGGSSTGYRLQWYLYETGKTATDTGSGATFKPLITNGNLSIVVSNGTTCNNLIFKPMIRLSSISDNTYEPYENICPISGRTQTVVSVNSEDTTIPFNQTVYGGEVDVTSGGTKPKYYIEYDGSNDEYWEMYNAAQGKLFRTSSSHRKTSVELVTLGVFCNAYKVVSQQNRADGTLSGGTGSGQYGTIDFIDNRFSSLDQWRANLSSNPVQLCFDDSNPTEINTPAFDIPLNKGNNTLTADGDMELVYSKTPQ